MEREIVTAQAGRLSVDTQTGFGGNVTIGVQDATTPLWLSIFAEVAANEDLLIGVAPVLDAFPAVETAARAALVDELCTGSQVREFIEFHVEELGLPVMGEILAAFTNGAMSADALVAALAVESLVFHVTDEGQLAYWMDFVVDAGRSDEVLAVRFDADSVFTGVIDWES
ncbi:DUF2004 domain-containing protein [Catenulispora pinisilvae]|uniref:DUF2004 domain-containing protein n=1 Tax=Catenulispora pinisilvae TaxID=2705253 RepID=UPI001890F268|nr:DUF2004 domain-containing protein [Catenulispora pinisilvae]